MLRMDYKNYIELQRFLCPSLPRSGNSHCFGSNHSGRKPAWFGLMIFVLNACSACCKLPQP